MVGELVDGDDFLTGGAVASGAEPPAGAVAVGAPLLGEVEGVAVGALVDGAVQPGPRRWRWDLRRGGLVALAVGGLAAGWGAEAPGPAVG